MTSDGNPFWFVPTLQHLATVKMIEMLLRHSEQRELMKEAAWQIRFVWEGQEERALLDMIFTIIKKVDRHGVAVVLTEFMQTPLLAMAMSASHWLAMVEHNTPSQLKDRYWSETIYELITHLQWDDFVCVDGRKTLESYVSKRETVDFLIWNMLCFHCMEEEIIRFSSTIDWKECNNFFASAPPLYWYRKIYGEWPTEEMFQSDSYHPLRQCFLNEDEIEEKTMLKIMFIMDNPQLMLETGRTVSAIRYFRNRLQDEATFLKLVTCTKFVQATDEVILYLLRTIKPNTWCRMVYDGHTGINVINALVRLSFIRFIDYWISVFEAVDAQWFTRFFWGVGRTSRKVINCPIQQFHEPFHKVWKIFLRRFSSDVRTMACAFLNIFLRYDIIMCKLMFIELVDEERIRLLEGVIDEVELRRMRKNVEPKFSEQFSEQVLKNEQERELYSQIYGMLVENRR